MTSGGGVATTAAATNGPALPAPVSAPTESARQDIMRAYRACLHCRSRKTKCTLDINGGRPPCRRCQRENRDCVLGESHRGGRRVRKKAKIEGTPSPSGSGLSLPPMQAHEYTSDPASTYSQHHQQGQPISNQLYGSPYDPRFSWQNSGPSAIDSPVPSNYSRSTDQASPGMTSYPSQAISQSSLDPKIGPRPPARESIAIASTDLQNPSDALDILARVADRADEDSTGSGQGNTPRPNRSLSRVWKSPLSPLKTDHLYYKPVNDGSISHDLVYDLFQSFQQHYHPYFPIVPRETFDRSRIPWLSKAEPHLFSAILTVASKDNEGIHQVCYDHMQHLVSMILAGADADVEAVQALLLLSQWVSHRPQAQISVGRGEEDRVAWMYIGTALRLGYFLGIDRTAFKSSDNNEHPASFNRKRLTWAFCYICDRTVSVRLGKGFWARGPGPLSGLRASDFPSLQPTETSEDNWATIFQANLELTQIFSNVHDILYSSKGHGWREMLEGRYAKHLDDFRTSIRHWNDKWEGLICSNRLKTSLRLTYDYLRLYVNAFAYQATVSRAMSFSRESQSRTVPSIDAATPDARFIYEAIDGAKSLLKLVDECVDPETLRYMPCTYYLFIIYSAVFLYKARATTTMSETERTEIRNLINRIIDLLQKSSAGSNGMGSRYSRLLQLLWRRSPKKTQPRDKVHPQSIDNLLIPVNNQPNMISNNQVYEPMSYNGLNMQGGGEVNTANTGNTFSWLDLGAAWSFATQNASHSQSSGEIGDMMGEGGSSGFSPFDVNMNLLTDYQSFNDEGTGLIF